MVRVARPAAVAIALALSATAAATAGVRPGERKVAVIAGRPALIPIVPDDVPIGERPPNDWTPEGLPEITFVTGDRLDCEVYRIVAEAPGPAERRGWLPPTPRWSALTVEEVRARRGSSADVLALPGYWALLVDVPSTARGRELRLDGRAMTISWINPPPALTDLRRAPRPRASPAAARALGDTLRGEAADPSRRWRAALIADRLTVPALWGRAEESGGMPHLRLGSRALDVLAEQNEWRWRAALASLARESPDVSADLLARLTAVVLTPEGVLLPCWPPDEHGAARLRAALLDPQVRPEEAADLARTFLQSVPAAVAWLIDDSRPDGRVSIGVADLTGRRSVFTAALDGEKPGEPTTVEGHESAVLTLAIPKDGPLVRVAEVRAGRWAGRVVVRAAPMRVSPPGLVLALTPGWFMESWMMGGAPVSRQEWSAAAMLHRPRTHGPWEVYVECRIPEGVSAAGDVVRLRVGASESAGRTIEVKPTRVSADRWTAVAPLPEDAAEADGTVRLSLERETAEGVRLTWPGPMLPGDREPARGRLDLRAWGDLVE